MKKIIGIAAFAAVLFAGAFPIQEAFATAQWARKYKINCQTCHTGFPRLTYFGEQFQRNGYQLPDTQDGDEQKEKLSDTSFIDNLINMFGIRIAVTPASATTNELVRNGRLTTRFSLGNTNWIQLFTAGTIFKNTSIFIETEIENAAVHNNWFTLGYHNLFDQKLLNLRIGKLSVMNWHAQPGRLRMIPNINIEGWRNFQTSEGTASTTTREDPVAMGEPQPGIELYGYQGPFLYSVGVTNGNALTDNNQFKNVFGTLRLEKTKGNFAGSAVSGWGYIGTDTATTSTTQRKNRFYRASGAGNLRWKAWDLIVAYLYGRDNDWILSTVGSQRNTTHAFSWQLAYFINPKWYAAGQYDYVTDLFKLTTTTSNDFHKISPSIWFMPRENMRIGLVNRYELRGRAGGRQHEFILHARSMF